MYGKTVESTHKGRRAMAHAAERPAAVRGHLPADLGVTPGRGVRGHRACPARRAPSRRGQELEPSASCLTAAYPPVRPRKRCAGYDSANRKTGLKVHMVADTLGHLLALRVTAASEQERAQV
jgi:hypothetical protein